MFDRALNIVEENLVLIAVFILTLIILNMIGGTPTLTDNEGFMYLATGIIITGLVNGIIQKNTDRQQKSNAETVQTLAAATMATTPTQPAIPPVTDSVVIETETALVNTNEQPKPSSNRQDAGSARPSWVEPD